MEKLIKKILLLNQTYLHSVDESNASIIKNFTEMGIGILGADFGFAWGKFNDDGTFKLIYKSAKAPKNPLILKEKNGKSLIIPIKYEDNVYGSIVFGYKKKHKITKEELVVSETLGNTIAQLVTINWLVEKEEKSLALAQKQKETEVLLEQEKLKTEFIANATHELRTPLAIMKGNLDLVLLSKKDPKQIKNTFRAISEEISILSEILSDLALLTSRNKNSKQATGSNRLNLTDLIEEVIKRLDTLAEKKGIDIQLKNKKKADLFISGDKKNLKKLFLNLAKNAITYGKEGGYIKVGISKENDNVKVKISDNGIGIPREDLPKIFERFYQVDKAHTGSNSGLGLAIAKWVVETHKGKINVESKYGKGSIFTVTLPLSRN